MTENVIDDAAPVIDDAGTRRGQLRDAGAMARAGRCQLELEHKWLDALEESGSWRARARGLDAAADNSVIAYRFTP
jgi:predicted kinase